uniref:Potassium channel blocker pMeKTx24-1 n=1 Tax=Mesobuthus eupeus TaxID=34648 RepID=A0A088D9T6_MESEU|nr:potassium channel blocker pMeKTx24-1 [Mesobuthus eupeus]
MNNYYKIVLIMVAFFAVTITFSNIQVEAQCNKIGCYAYCWRKRLIGHCVTKENCKCFNQNK